MAKKPTRKHGEGSVYQRKDGRYVAEIKLETGKKKLVYRKTEKEANAALRKLLHEQEQGILATGPQQTVKAYLTQWLEKVIRNSRKVATYSMYQIVVEKHIIPSLGHIRLQRLTPSHVQSFYTAKLDEGLSLSRVHSIHLVLHKALENAVKWRLVGQNVSKLVDVPKPKRHEIQPLDMEQARRLLLAAHEHKLEALITVAITTGMRRGELMGLHWQDIDLEQGTIQIQRTVNRVGKFGMVVSEPKTSRSRRKIELPMFVVEVLKYHRERQQAIKKLAGNSWQDMDIVFSNTLGGYSDPSNLTRWFKALLKNAGLPDIRFHDLRHSAATLLLAMSVNPKIVQELLGHSSITMTMDIYSHVLPPIQSEAMGKMDSLFKPPQQ